MVRQGTFKQASAFGLPDLGGNKIGSLGQTTRCLITNNRQSMITEEDESEGSSKESDKGEETNKR